MEIAPLRTTIWLPWIGGGSSDPCALIPFAQEFLDSLRSHQKQRRKSLTCHPLLQQAAQGRAQEMYLNGTFGHVNLAGQGPNDWVRSFGYVLPKDYPGGTANSIESIARDYFTPQAALTALLNSPKHRVHLLGEQSFFAAQIHCGVGVAGDFTRPHVYWCFLSAP